VDRLWAPWRMKYILSTTNPDMDEVCVFCKMLEESDDERNLILCRGNLAFVVMNLFPYNNGHLLIVPQRHTGDFASLSEAEHLELTHLLRISQQVITETMSPHGFNLGMNLGRVSGAGILDHLHYHVVPRWNGDCNFMPVVAETKVISEDLKEGWKRLRSGFDREMKNFMLENRR
jgi:ATP adenylyltransferase